MAPINPSSRVSPQCSKHIRLNRIVTRRLAATSRRADTVESTSLQRGCSGLVTRCPSAVPNNTQQQSTPSTANVSATPTTSEVSIGRRMVLLAAAAILSTSMIGPVQANAPKTTTAGENVGFLSNEEIERDRAAHRIKRAFDGKVAVQGKKDKHWYDLKVEPNMPGLIYFRKDDGQVYYVAYGSLSQCDLADDDMVGALSDDDWETAIRNVEFEGEKPGTTQKLELTREGFYSITSLLRGDE